MIEIIVSVLLIVGSLLMPLAAIGIMRMPDFFTRMQAGTKASSLGAALLLIAFPLHFGQVSFFTRALAAILFIFLTAPIAAHMLSRAAYLRGSEMWEGTVRDEWQGK